ncbi:hypothetical protein D3C86_1195240 [compost metagenome]
MISAISLPRIAPICRSDFSSSGSERKSIRSAVTVALFGRSRMAARPVVDFPEPDSPTMPTLSRPTSKLTLDTAGMVLRPKRTLRSRTERMGELSGTGMARIQEVAQRIAGDVEGKARQQDGDAGHDGDPPVIEHELAAAGDHCTPFRQRRLGS